MGNDQSRLRIPSVGRSAPARFRPVPYGPAGPDIPESPARTPPFHPESCFAPPKSFFPHSRSAYRSRKAARPAADHRHITGFCLNFFHLDTVFLCIEFKFAESSVPSLAKTRFGYKDATASPQGILRVPRRPAAMSGQQTDFLIARYGEAAQQKFGWCSLALCPTTVAGRS